MDLYYAVVDLLRAFMLFVGSAIVFIGIAQAALEALRSGSGKRVVGQRIGTHASLGLEFFVGAGILNLILNPTWSAIGAAALIIVIRKLLTFSLARSAA